MSSVNNFVHVSKFKELFCKILDGEEFVLVKRAYKWIDCQYT